jgi:hypothetical protein
MKKGLAWHFVGSRMRDGRKVPPDGKWLEHDGVCVMCARGLHFSRTPWDAFRYAPGPIICRVEIDGIAKEEKDKGVCCWRRIVERRDASCILDYFSRMQALSVVDLWRECPQDCVLDFLMTGYESLINAAHAAALRVQDIEAGVVAESAENDVRRKAVGAFINAIGAKRAVIKRDMWMIADESRAAMDRASSARSLSKNALDALCEYRRVPAEFNLLVEELFG